MESWDKVVCIFICLFYKAFVFASIRSILRSKKVSIVVLKALGFSVLSEVMFKIISYLTSKYLELAIEAGSIVVGIIMLPFIIFVLNDFKFWGTTHWE